MQYITHKIETKIKDTIEDAVLHVSNEVKLQEDKDIKRNESELKDKNMSWPRRLDKSF